MDLPKKKRGFWEALNKYKWLYLMVAPGVILLIVFSYFPMYGIQVAFKQFSPRLGIWASPWNGFDNYRFLLQQREFWRAVQNTLIISFSKLAINFPAPLILALLLNEVRNMKYKRIVQTLLYIPHFLSWVIIYGMFFSLFSNQGAITSLLKSTFNINLEGLLTKPEHFRTILYTTDVWKGAGWGTIIYLAAIAGINPELYEAAIIDGATRFQRVMKITMPTLKYTIGVLLILSCGGMLSAGFDQVLNFYTPATYTTGDIIDTYIYRISGLGGGNQSGARMEYGASVGIATSVINCILLLTTNFIVEKLGDGGIF